MLVNIPQVRRTRFRCWSDLWDETRLNYITIVIVQNNYIVIVSIHCVLFGSIVLIYEGTLGSSSRHVCSSFNWLAWVPTELSPTHNIVWNSHSTSGYVILSSIKNNHACISSTHLFFPLQTFLTNDNIV